MTPSPADPAADAGLLTPCVAGTAAERLTGDAALVDAMLRAETALLHALVQTGLAPAGAEATADQIAAATPDPRELALAAPRDGNPVIGLVRRLREGLGPEPARWVHHGATSQDILDTALMVVATDVLVQAEADLARAAERLAALAAEHRDRPVVARTLTQQALPTTLGLRCATWLAGVHDAMHAVRGLRPLPAALGGPVGTTHAYGASGPQVVAAYAARLGLADPVAAWHTRRGPVLGLGHALTQVGEACGKVAADVLVLAQTEVGEVAEAVGGGSSSMPHKQNPTQAVLLASAARQLPGLGAVLAAAGAPEQERPAGAWHAEWQPLREMLRLAGGAAERTADLVEGLVFDHDAASANLQGLAGRLGQDNAWVARHVEAAVLWVDRVLAQHREVRG